MRSANVLALRQNYGTREKLPGLLEAGSHMHYSAKSMLYISDSAAAALHHQYSTTSALHQQGENYFQHRLIALR